MILSDWIHTAYRGQKIGACKTSTTARYFTVAPKAVTAKLSAPTEAFRGDRLKNNFCTNQTESLILLVTAPEDPLAGPFQC